MPNNIPFQVELDAIEQAQQRRTAARQIAEQLREEEVLRAAQIGLSYSWLPPGASIALARVGMTVEQVHGIAEKALIWSRDNPAEAAEFGEKIEAQRVIDKWKNRGGIGRAVTGGIGDALSKTGDVVAGLPGMGAVKGASRFATAALDVPRQYVQAEWRYAANAVEQEGFAGAAKKRVKDTIQSGGIAPFDVGQQIDFVRMTSAAARGERVDAGTGFFVGGDEKRLRDQWERRLGTVTYADGSTHSRTIGRDLARGVGLEPGSTEFSILSGLGDFVVAVAADRVGTMSAAEGKAAARFTGRVALPEDASVLDRALDTIGAFRNPGGRNVYDPAAVSAWLGSREGTNVAERVAATTSVRDLDLLTGQRLPVPLLRELADTTDVDDIKAVLSNRLGLDVTSNPVTGRARLAVDMHTPATTRRLLDVVPAQRVNLADSRQFVTQIERWGTNMKLDRDVIGGFVDEAARLADDTMAQAERSRILDRVIDAGVESFAGGDPERTRVARELLKLEKRYRVDDEVAYWVDQVGRKDRSFFGVVVDGGEAAMPGRATPTAMADLIRGHRTMPDPRDVRRLFDVAAVRAATKLPGFEAAERGLNTLSDVWKRATILRPATTLRVVAESQARMAAGGVETVFSHPISFITAAVTDSRFGHRLGKGSTDALGELTTSHDELAEVLTGSEHARNMWGEGQRVLGDSYVKLRPPRVDAPAEPGFWEAWHDELARQHVSPDAQMLVRADSLDDAKEAWWSQATLRERMGKLFPPSDDPNVITGAHLKIRSGSDAYMEQLAERVTTLTQANGELVEAIRTGRVVTDDGRLVPITLGQGTRNPEFTKLLEDRFGDVAQRLPGVIGRKAISDDSAVQGVYRAATDWMFGWLYAAPDNVLDKIPTYKEFYWRRVRELSPAIDPADAPALIHNAGASKELAAIKAAAGTASRKLSIEELHDLAKAAAIDDSKRLLFDLHERNQFFDAARMIFPFGEAWRELITRWSKLIATEPKVMTSAMRVHNVGLSPEFSKLVAPDVSVLDEEGEPVQRPLLYTDEFGVQRFTYPLSGKLLDMVGLPNVPVSSPVAGLNIGFELQPGLGPVAQIPVAALMPRDLEAIDELLFPYGRPEGSAPERAAAFLPGWFKKVMNKNGSLDKRQWGGTVHDAMRYLASTGEFDLTSDEGVNRLIHEATTQGSWLVALRGVGQFTLPASPSYEWVIEGKDGRNYAALTLSKELQRMREESPDTYVLDFLDRFGDNALLLLQGKTRSVSPGGGLPPTAEAADWLKTRSGVQDDYGLAYGFFAPQGGEIDMRAYDQTLRMKERVLVDPELVPKTANSVVAQAIYYQARGDLMKANGTRPLTGEQSLWLYDLRQKLADRYPGYSPTGAAVPGTIAKAEPAQVIAELERAVNDERLADSPVTPAVKLYLDARAQAQAQAKQAFGRDDSWKTRSEAIATRDWLYQIGSALAEETPDFKSVWENALLREFDTQLAEDERKKANR